MKHICRITTSVMARRTLRGSLIALLFLFSGLRPFAQPGANDATFNLTDQGFGYGDGAAAQISAIAVQSDGKIVIGGSFTRYNGTTVGRITRLNADGTIDASFNPGAVGAGGTVSSIAVLSDGKILIVGEFTTYNGTTIGSITRLNTDGTMDGTFNTGGAGANFDIVSMAILSDGKILIGGNFTTYNGTTVGRITRLNADGTRDATFQSGNGVNGTISSIVVLSDGKILIGGVFTTYNGTTGINRIARLNADGTLDTGFTMGTGPSSSVVSIAVQSDGKILIGGNFTTYNGATANRIARLNANGALDTEFTIGTGPDNSVTFIVVLSDGKILIGGGFTNYNSSGRSYFVRLNAGGSLDGTFPTGTGPSGGSVNSIVFQTDGKILLGGAFSFYNGSGRGCIARLSAGGELDLTFNPGSGGNNSVASIAVQPDGKILIGGFFTIYNGTIAGRIARLNANGTLDGTFNPGGTGAGSTVNSLAVQSDGRILIGGGFTTYNGTTGINRIARLNANGTLDDTFIPGAGAGSTVRAIKVLSDGKILIAGDFTTYRGTTGINRIARLNADGTLDDTFNPSGTGAGGTIFAIAVQSDGRILIGGSFTSYNGTTGLNRIVRLKADGTLDDTFNPGTGVGLTSGTPSVSSIELQSDGKILIGGSFTTYSSTARNRIARLNSNGTLDDTFDPGTGVGVTTGTPSVSTLAVQSDGKILIGGSFTSYNGTDGFNRIVRLNADGTLDGTFNPGGTGAGSTVNSLAVQSDGKILIGGAFTSYNGTGRNRLARLLTGDVLATQPTAQPTALYFTTTGTNPYNLVGRFTASASATGYLVVRNTGSAPTFTPADGTAYTAGSQTGGTVVYSGTASEFTESSVTTNTAYHYAVYAYNGSGATINYLTTSPLTGQSQVLTSGSGTLASTGTATSLGFPGAGAIVNFPAGTTGTTVNVSRVNSAPFSNFQVNSSVRGMKPVYFRITSSNPSPGGYTLILDFSGLGTLTPTQWNSYKITKRANVFSPWVDVTTLGATIVNRKTDNVWGKFTITGLSSFSEFGLAEVFDGTLVSNLAEANAGFSPVTDDNYNGQAFVTDGIRYQLSKVKVSALSPNTTNLRARLYGSTAGGEVESATILANLGTPTQVGSTSVYELTPTPATVKLEPNTQYWIVFYSNDENPIDLHYTTIKSETGPARFPTKLSVASVITSDCLCPSGSSYQSADEADPYLFSIEATEVTRTWTGTSTTDWSTAGNWTPSEIPGSGEILTIPNVANYPVLPANTSVAYLTVASNAVVDLADKTLTVTHGLSQNGTITATTGRLKLAGSETQAIEGTGTIANLEIDNPLGATMMSGSSQTLTGALTPTQGTLTTSGNLTLKSSSSGTARVATLGATASISGEVVAERFIKQNTNDGGTGRAWRLVSIPVTGSGTLRDFFMNGRNGQDLTVSTNRDAETANSGTPIVGHNHATASAANTAGFDWIGVANQVSSLRRYVGNATGGTFLSENVPVMTTDYSNADQGYMVFTRGDRKVEFPSPSNASATTFRSTGALKTGDQTVSVVPSGTSQYTLVGNPYMSVLDLSLLHAHNSAVIKPGFWIWDANIAGTHKQGGYVRVSFNGTSWVTNTGAYTNPERIESGMAFFVEPIDGLSVATNITIKEAHKSAATAAGIVPYGSESSDGHGLFYARLETPASGGVREVVDGVLIDFHKDFKESLGDLGDGEKLRNTISQGALWLSREGRNLVAEGLPWPGADKRSIPLYMGSVGVQQRVLRLDPRGMAERYVKAWLKDRHLNTETEVDMSKGLDYAFTGTGAVATDLERFELVFVEAGRPTTGGVAIEPGGGSPSVRLYPNPSRSTEVRLSLRSMPTGEYRVEVLDMSGRMVARTRFTHRGDSGEYSVLEGRRLSPGRYVVRLIDCNGVVQVLQLVGR